MITAGTKPLLIYFWNMNYLIHIHKDALLLVLGSLSWLHGVHLGDLSVIMNYELPRLESVSLGYFKASSHQDGGQILQIYSVILNHSALRIQITDGQWRPPTTFFQLSPVRLLYFISKADYYYSWFSFLFMNFSLYIENKNVINQSLGLNYNIYKCEAIIL